MSGNVLFFEYAFGLFSDARNLSPHDIPHKIAIDAEVIVDQAVSHPGRIDIGGSLVHVFSVAHSNNVHHPLVIIDRVDYAVVAYSDPPQQFAADQFLTTRRARLFCKPFDTQKYAVYLLLVKRLKFLTGAAARVMAYSAIKLSLLIQPRFD